MVGDGDGDEWPEDEVVTQVELAARGAVPAAPPAPAPRWLVESLPEWPAEMARCNDPEREAWDREIVARVLVGLMQGRTLSDIRREPWGPSAATWHRWIHTIPALREAEAGARMVGAHAVFDEIIDTAREGLRNPINEVHNSARRIMIDALKWAAGKLNPVVYADRDKGAAPVTIQIRTSLPLDDASVTSGAAMALETTEVDGIYTVAAPVSDPLTALGAASSAANTLRGAESEATAGERVPPHRTDAERAAYMKGLRHGRKTKDDPPKRRPKPQGINKLLKARADMAELVKGGGGGSETG